MQGTPGIEAIRALHGRQVAMLTDEERAVLKFYVTEGRKHGVAVSMVSNADRAEIAAAKSKEQVGDILRRANSVISVTVSS